MNTKTLRRVAGSVLITLGLLVACAGGSSRPAEDVPDVPDVLIRDLEAEVAPDVVCNVLCPPLPGFAVSCNPQNHCEYRGTAVWGDEVLIWVPPGAFPMGSCPIEDELSSCEGTCEHPRHVVHMATGYWIDKYEATAAAYAFCPERECGPPECIVGEPTAGNLPVTCVTFWQSRGFCAWRGPDYALCSEAQWEYAAKGPSQRRYPWGDEEPLGRANCAEEVCADGWAEAAPVTAMPSDVSAVGAAQMAGNVFEWVEDDWHYSYRDAGRPDDGSAWVDTPRAQQQVTRGGFYRSDGPGDLRTSSRGWSNSSDPEGGFRCCRTPASPPTSAFRDAVSGGGAERDAGSYPCPPGPDAWDGGDCHYDCFGASWCEGGGVRLNRLDAVPCDAFPVSVSTEEACHAGKVECASGVCENAICSDDWAYVRDAAPDGPVQTGSAAVIGASEGAIGLLLADEHGEELAFLSPTLGVDSERSPVPATSTLVKTTMIAEAFDELLFPGVSDIDRVELTVSGGGQAERPYVACLGVLTVHASDGTTGLLAFWSADPGRAECGDRFAAVNYVVAFPP